MASHSNAGYPADHQPLRHSGGGVALALTVLWGGESVEFVRPALPEDRPSISRRLTGWTGELSDSLTQAMSGLSALFDNLNPNRIA